MNVSRLLVKFSLIICLLPSILSSSCNAEDNSEPQNKWITEPELLLKFLRHRDAQLDDHTLTVDKCWSETVSPLAVLGDRNFKNFKFGMAPEPIPNDIPEPYEQPHRVRYQMTTRDDAVTILQLGDLEEILHPEYTGKLVENFFWGNASGDLVYYYPGEEMVVKKGPLELGSQLRFQQHKFQWTSGFGFASFITEIDSIEVAMDSLQVTGSMKLLENGSSTFTLELDNDYIVRKADITLTADPASGSNRYTVTTTGTVLTEHVPPLAESGEYQRILQPKENPASVYEEHRIEHVSISELLTPEEYTAASTVEPEPETEVEIEENRRN